MTLREAVLNSRSIDLTGKVFGSLSVISYSHSRKGHAIWMCACECGITKNILGHSLRSGATLSCGCVGAAHRRASATKYGAGRTKEAGVWRSMIARCHDPKSSGFEHYGGRGIFVCTSWRDSFIAFISDMGICPDKLTLERVNNNLGYSKDNCKWATLNEQARNKRNSLLYQGVPLANIAETLKIPYATAYARLKKNGTPYEQPGHST